MNRTVQVSAAMLTRLEPARRIPVARGCYAPVLMLEMKRLRSRPVDRLFIKRVSEIDKLRDVDGTCQRPSGRERDDDSTEPKRCHAAYLDFPAGSAGRRRIIRLRYSTTLPLLCCCKAR